MTTGRTVEIPVVDDGNYHGLDVDGGTPAAPGSLVRYRRGTAAQWAAADPVLEDGESGFERDTGRTKTGPGAWNSLPYDDVLAAEAAVGVAVALGGA